MDEWEHAAGLLGQACAANWFEIDSKCTTDAVRILRPPETLNHKYDPKPTVEGVELGPDYIFDEFMRQLKAAAGGGDTPASPRPNGATPALRRDNGHDATSSAAIPFDGPPANAELIAEKCAHIQNFKETGCREYEPLWWTCLGVLARCETGDAVAHEWSAKDAL